MFSKSKKAQPTTPDPAPARDTTRLPQGAEAALWSIVESIPDPRNHLALTRDPTAEVRVSRRQIDEAMAAPRPRAQETPSAGVIDSPAEAPADTGTAPLPRRDGIRWSSDTAEVRLPALAGPQDLEGEDASVHTLDPAINQDAPDEHPATRYARGA